MLKGKKVLIGITGSIAAYKIIQLVRILKKSQAEVKVILTASASQFVSPLVLETLSGNKVLTELSDASTWSNHVQLGRWADLFLIAPTSCNTIAKMANGLCDNLLLAVYLSATCPVWISPAMDEDMWLHPATHTNLEKLKEHKVKILDVVVGELASGLFGPGRMMEPEDIFTEMEVFFREKTWNGKTVLITAGPTYEAIDPVRFIGNHSSGKMGFALAESFYLKGAEVILITGPVHIQTKFKGINRIYVTSAQEMYEAVYQYFDEVDVAILAAAVADYYLPEQSEIKIKKQPNHVGLQLDLAETKDILASLGQTKKNQIVIGFALETNNEVENAKKKLEKKKVDAIILNSLQEEGAGFGTDTNKVSIIYPNGDITDLPFSTKKDVAEEITKTILNRFID